MQLLHIKGRDKGSITGEQKLKSLNERWFSKHKMTPSGSDDDGDRDENTFIQRNSHIKVRVSGGSGSSAISDVEDFQVLEVYTKKYNRWQISEMKRHKWMKGMDEGRYRVPARNIKFNHSTGTYQDMVPADSRWSTKMIYILVDGNGIEDIFRIVELDY